MNTTTWNHHTTRSRRRPPCPAHLPDMERLEDRVLLSVAGADFVSAEPIGSLVWLDASGLADVQKLIVAGDLAGTPSDSPGLRVDPNTVGSPYAGVGSLRVDATGFDGYTYIGSATAISPTHVLTAAHMLDLDNNGTIDVTAADVTFNLNFGSDLSHVITASALTVHPDWTGFASPSINDDLAVIELSTPLPAGVPIYSLNTDPFVNIETITLVGYGLSGDGVNGYDFSLGTSWSVKRVGFNRTDVYISDDEGSGSREGWQLDFDGPSKKTNLYGRPRGTNLTLGNDIETTLGGGDSGGPSFIDDGAGGLEIFGVNTFGFGGKASSPLFGSGAGGIVVSTYAEWILSVVGDVPASPGVTVTPASGLQTSEAGGTAVFTVVLDTQPTADVTIALSSSDTSEGTVDKTSLTFTSLNWDTAQTVTVTGVDDAVLDGDVAYTIVTAAATSGDGDYSGLDVADVSVTNIDDEAPAETLTIAKATYNSRRGQLTVEATSSLGGDTALEATFFVGGVQSAPKSMSYNAKKGKWSVTFTSADGLGGSKPEKVRVSATSTGAYVEKTDVGGKSIPVATGRATRAANITLEGLADSPVLLPAAGSTRVSAAAPQRADVSVSLTVAELSPLAENFTTTDSQQSPPLQLVDLVSGGVEDAPADDQSAGEMDLDLHAVPLGGELLEELLLLR